MKLYVDEAESRALRAFTITRQPLASTVIAAVEVGRVVHRRRMAALHLRDSVTLVELTEEIIETASAVEPLLVRTLDAIHLATALSLGEQLDAFVAYDDRLLEAARENGLETVSPA